MKPYLLIALLAFSPLSISSASAGEGLNNPQMDEAARAMEEAAQNLTRVLSMVLRSIPQYETPKILPNGDILIRRVHPQKQEETVPTEGSKI